MISSGIDWSSYTASHPYYGDFQYSIKRTTHRRILYKAYSVMDDGQVSLFPLVYCVVTNDEKIVSKDGMHFYELRGVSENYTKEFKNDFDGARVSHKEFWANEMDFLISAFAYNIFHLFQKIAVKVVRHAGNISLCFSSAYMRKHRFMNYWNAVLLM